MDEQQVLDPPRRVVKHRETGRFYAGDGCWVDKIEQAKDFASVWVMVEEVSRYGLKGQCVLFLDFGGTDLDIEIEL